MDLEAKIPKEQIDAWLNNPTTIKIMDALRAVRDQHYAALHDGQTLALASAESTALQTTLLLGKISGMNLLLEISVGSEE